MRRIGPIRARTSRPQQAPRRSPLRSRARAQPFCSGTALDLSGRLHKPASTFRLGLPVVDEYIASCGTDFYFPGLARYAGRRAQSMNEPPQNKPRSRALSDAVKDITAVLNSVLKRRHNPELI